MTRAHIAAWGTRPGPVFGHWPAPLCSPATSPSSEYVHAPAQPPAPASTAVGLWQDPAAIYYTQQWSSRRQAGSPQLPGIPHLVWALAVSLAPTATSVVALVTGLSQCTSAYSRPSWSVACVPIPDSSHHHCLSWSLEIPHTKMYGIQQKHFLEGSF